MIQEKVYTSLMIAKDCTRLSAKKCGFTLASLKEDNRRRAYADMRSMLMHMLRNTTALSLSDIGWISESNLTGIEVLPYQRSHDFWV